MQLVQVKMTLAQCTMTLVRFKATLGRFTMPLYILRLGISLARSGVHPSGGKRFDETWNGSLINGKASEPQQQFMVPFNP